VKEDSDEICKVFSNVDHPIVEIDPFTELMNSLYFASIDEMRGVIYEDIDETIDSAKFVLVFSKLIRRVSVARSVLSTNDCVEIVDISFVLMISYNVLNDEISWR
jgi:hypothetical protein